MYLWVWVYLGCYSLGVIHLGRRDGCLVVWLVGWLIDWLVSWFWGKVSHVIHNSPSRLSWLAGEAQDLPVSVSPTLESPTTTTLNFVYMSCSGLTLVLCKLSTLLAEPLPRPKIFLFMWFLERERERERVHRLNYSPSLILRKEKCEVRSQHCPFLNSIHLLPGWCWQNLYFTL